MNIREPIVVLCLCAVLYGCNGGADGTTTWEHSYSGLYDAAISNDGRFAVVASFSAGTSYWDLQANSRLYDWRHDDSDDGEIAQVAFAPNSSHVITANARTFVIWDTQTGQALGYWSVDADITDVAISNDARFVLLGLADGRAIHIDQRTQRRLEVIAHRNERVTNVDLTADGMIAATGGKDGRVMVWNAATGDELHVIEHADRIVMVKFDPSRQRLLTADEQGDAFIWELETGSKLATLNLEKRQHVISAARFSPDGARLLLGFPGRDVRLWNTESGQLIHSWRTPNKKNGWVPQGSTVYAVAFNEHDHSIIAESSNGLGRAWSAPSTN